ncbi:energy transducer TonB [Butyricimonas muris]|uniref:energy transducer TonB n=1 Tax=Butyricimonas muris TaxID=3378067 RepID=UPI003966BADF
MAFVVKRAWKTGLFLLFTCWFTGVSVAEVSASVKDSLSYENYCKMLERETRVPVSEIPNDEGMKYLQERIKAMKKEYGNDKRAYAAMVEQLRVHIRQESYDHARRLMITAKLTNTRIDDLEAVCYYFNSEKLKLMKELGPKNFIYNYLVAYPKFAHLKILQEAKMREFMNENDRRRHFLKNVMPYTLSYGQVADEEMLKDCFYVQMPVFAQGNVMAWISQNVKYPPEAIKINAQGKVFVSFVIETDGSITDVKVVKGCNPFLEQEAKRVVRCFPKYIPAWCPIKKRSFRTTYTAPISFRLSSPPHLPDDLSMSARDLL